MNSEHLNLVTSSLLEGMGFVRLNRLRESMARLGDDAWAWCLGRPAAEILRRVPALDGATAEALASVTDAQRDYAKRLLDRVGNTDTLILARSDGDYPEAFRRNLGESAPPLLFVLGNAALLDERCLGVVGSREATRRGLSAGADCGRYASRNGVAVASGAARGVDMAAHEAALASGGRTVAFVPEGILAFSIPKAFRKGLDEGTVCIATPFRPDAPWSTHQAIVRNSYIATASAVVCVIEPLREGGSALTGRVALGQGTSVFVGWKRDSEPPEATAEGLRGAAALYNAADTVDFPALDAAWSAPPRRPQEQTELFG